MQKIFNIVKVERFEIINDSQSAIESDIIDNIFNSQIEREHALFFLIAKNINDETKHDGYYLYIPLLQFGEEFFDYDKLISFEKQNAGCQMIINIEEEFNPQIKRTLENQKIFKPHLVQLNDSKIDLFSIYSTISANYDSKIYLINGYTIVKSNISDFALNLYKKINRYHSQFIIRANNTYSNFTEGGYDSDSAFGGEREAYWNID